MAERVTTNLARADLRLQIRQVVVFSPSWPRYRFGRLNGWHCGHWHKNIEQAAECIELKLWKP